MKLQQYDNRHVRIVDSDGRVWNGKINEYIYPEDNEDEKESIVLESVQGDLIEFNEDDIRSIVITQSDKPI